MGKWVISVVLHLNGHRLEGEGGLKKAAMYIRL